MVVGLGLLAATGYAVKQYLAPRVSQWLREWRGSADAEAAAAAEREKSAQLVAAAVASQVQASPHLNLPKSCILSCFMISLLGKSYGGCMHGGACGRQHQNIQGLRGACVGRRRR